MKTSTQEIIKNPTLVECKDSHMNSLLSLQRQWLSVVGPYHIEVYVKAQTLFI